MRVVPSTSSAAQGLAAAAARPARRRPRTGTPAPALRVLPPAFHRLCRRWRARPYTGTDVVESTAHEDMLRSLRQLRDWLQRFPQICCVAGWRASSSTRHRRRWRATGRLRCSPAPPNQIKLSGTCRVNRAWLACAKSSGHWNLTQRCVFPDGFRWVRHWRLAESLYARDTCSIAVARCRGRTFDHPDGRGWARCFAPTGAPHWGKLQSGAQELCPAPSTLARLSGSARAPGPQRPHAQRTYARSSVYPQPPEPAKGPHAHPLSRRTTSNSWAQAWPVRVTGTPGAPMASPCRIFPEPVGCLAAGEALLPHPRHRPRSATRQRRWPVVANIHQRGLRIVAVPSEPGLVARGVVRIRRAQA